MIEEVTIAALMRMTMKEVKISLIGGNHDGAESV